jgi:hypothetical protein
MSEPDAPEAPCQYDADAAFAWQCGWTSGWEAGRAAAAAARRERVGELLLDELLSLNLADLEMAPVAVLSMHAERIAAAVEAMEREGGKAP